VFDHFGMIAPHYERAASILDPARLREHLRLPASGLLLDAGGGTGRVGASLRDMADGVVVCDVSLGMLKQAAAKNGIRTVRSPAEQLPFGDATFARILIVDAFHHFADHRRAIADLWRVLAPGGRIVIEEPNIDSLAVKVVALGERLILMRSTFYSPRQMGQMLAAVGGEVSVSNDHTFNSWVIADKRDA
jgi:ubiquinone/menaquinone biosynthesis C-methylase UbiE